MTSSAIWPPPYVPHGTPNPPINPAGSRKFPAGTLSPAFGCICPPGANLQCENPLCPRKPPTDRRTT